MSEEEDNNEVTAEEEAPGEEDDDRGTPFEDALHKVFDRNEASGKGPTSLRALARELVVLNDPTTAPTHATIEKWRRQLRRYVSGERQPRAATIAKIASAALATPDDFPKPQSWAEALQRLGELERENEDLRTRLDRLRREHP